MKGSCSALLLSGLALSFCLCSLIFVHPRPYPLTLVLSIAGGGRVRGLNVPLPPTFLGPWGLLSQGQELTDNDFSILNNYSSSWIWPGI